MARNAKTVTFAVAESDMGRLERLVDAYGGGNRSEFLRVAMAELESRSRAERLRRLQAIGARRSAERGIAPGSAVEIVHRVLRKHPSAAK